MTPVPPDESDSWREKAVFVERNKEDFGVSAEVFEECVDELIENGPIRSRVVDGTEYIRLTSRAGAMAWMAQAKASQSVSKIQTSLSDLRE